MASSILRWASRRISDGIFGSPNVGGGGCRYARIMTTTTKDDWPLPNFVEGDQLVGVSDGCVALLNGRNGGMFLADSVSDGRVKLPPIAVTAGCVSKVVVCSWPDEEECRVVMSYSSDTAAARLVFCSPGRSTQWTPIGNGATRSWEDFEYSRREKLLLRVTEDQDHPAEVEGWDIGDSLSARVNWIVREVEEVEGAVGLNEEETKLREVCRQRKYLVSAAQSPFLVVRHLCPRMRRRDGGWDYRKKLETIGFDVYKIEDGGKLRYMDGLLDGLVMFVGGMFERSFAKPAVSGGFPPPNSICFQNSYGLTPPGNHLTTTTSYGVGDTYDDGVFNYENRTFSSCTSPRHYHRSYRSNRGIVTQRIIPPSIWSAPLPFKP